MGFPAEHIEACAESHVRLLSALEVLTDDSARQPSLLPGWTRGHVLTHLARKADSHVWLFGGALVDEVRQQYPRPGMREGDVEAGAGRTADELRRDLTSSLAGLRDAFASLPSDRWDRTGIVDPGERTMAEIVLRHLRDVEVHHVDLDIGYFPSDWPAVFVEAELTKRLTALPSRANHADLLAWLLGRAEAPELKPW